MNMFFFVFFILTIRSKELYAKSSQIFPKSQELKKEIRDLDELANDEIVCPEKPTSNVVDLSSNPSTIPDYKNIYGCNLIIEKRLFASKSRLILYLCTFKSIDSTNPATTTGGAIYLSLTGNTNIPREVYQIERCTFEECKASSGGGIYVSNTQVDYDIEIIQSIFKNNEASTEGGALYIKSPWVNIERCQFDNNKCRKGSVLHFIYGSNKASTKVNFTFHDCTFKHEMTETDVTLSLISIMYNTNARFYFYNNQLDIINPNSEFHVFDSGDPISNNGKYVFSNNCISTNDESIIASSSASSLNINFETDFRNSCSTSDPSQPPEPTESTSAIEITQTVQPTEEIICPSKPSGPVDDLKNKPSQYTAKSVLYGCELEIQTKINSDQHCVHLYYCTFNDVHDSSLEGGGAIYIHTTGTDGPKEKNNHIFHCSFTNCQALQGGALSIATGQTSRFFNITECKFMNNEATCDGGAIYFKGVYSTIESCEFINNDAKDNGCDIYFECGESTGGSSKSPLLIQNSKFELTEERTSDMIYLKWIKSSDFVFNNNEVIIASTNTNFFIGSIGNLAEGSMSFSSNCISPSKDYICTSTNTELYKKIETGFPKICESNNPVIPTEIISSIEASQITEPPQTIEPTQETIVCPEKPTSNVVDLSSNPSSIPDYKNIYGCNLIIEKRLFASKSRLILYLCTFKSIDSTNPATTTGGAIYLSLTGNTNIPREVYQIERCTFEECKASSGGGIYVSNTQVDYDIEIIQSIFKNNEASTEGGALYIKSPWVNIERCQFDNNKCRKGSVLHFIYGSNKASTKVNFTFHDCTFKHEMTGTDVTRSLISIMYNTNARFYFYNNQLDIINPNSEFHVFDSGDPISNNGKYVFSNNCISTNDESIIASSSASSLNINFETDFRNSCSTSDPSQPPEPTESTSAIEITQTVQPTEEIICPSKPSGPVDDLKNKPSQYTAKSVLYGCELEIQTKINSDQHCVHLYYCTFNDVHDSSLEGGGAIYIHTTGTDGPKEKNNHIFHCSFTNCQALQGGALSIATGQTSRFFNITECKFMNNEATCDGGAIYFKGVYSTIESCEFINNDAKDNGCDIYFECGESTGGSSKSPLLIQNSKFELTEERTSDMIYLKWIKSSDFVFNNNEVIIASTNTNFFIGSIGNLAEGSMSFSSNCISPSKDYICTSTNTELYKKIETGFPKTCESNNPVIPTEIISSIETSQITEPPQTIEPTQETIVCPEKPTKKLVDISNDNYVIAAFDNIYGCNFVAKKRVDADRCHLIIYACQFKAMRSNSFLGGAIFIGLSSNTKISSDAKLIELCTFEGCSAKSGGAIYIVSKQNEHKFIMRRNIFNNNEASTYGGAVYFGSGIGTIEECQFTNNICPKGCDLYFTLNISTDSTNFTIYNNKFEKTFNDGDQTLSLVYVISDSKTQFFFSENLIDIKNPNTEIHVFDSDSITDSFQGEWIFTNNCITSTDEKIIASSNAEGLNINFETDFRNSCKTTEPTNPIGPTGLPDDLFPEEENQCTEDKRCNFTNENEKTVLVHITISHFNNLHQIDKNGAAICLIDCGLSCKGSTFKNCDSTQGGGGAIYIKNKFDVSNSIFLEKLIFNECKAVYGGAVYIYSSSDKSTAIIKSCTFESNENVQDDTNPVEKNLFGGSAVFMTVKQGQLMRNKFYRNIGNGGCVKLYNNFDDDAKLQYLEKKKNIVLISDCLFEIDERSNCSILYVGGKYSSVNEIKNCVFTGSLSKGNHYIDGQMLLNDSPKMRIRSCKFDSELKNSVNQDSKNDFASFDIKNQIFNYKKNDNKGENNKWMIASLSSLMVICTIVLLIIALNHFNYSDKNEITIENNETIDKQKDDSENPK